MSGELLVQAPSDFAHTISFMCNFAPMSGEQRLGPHAIARAMMVDGRVVVFELSAMEHPERLAYRLHSEVPLSFDARIRLLRRVRFQFGLDDDLVPFYARADDDPAFSRVVLQLYGMRHVKFPSAFEIACWAVLMQRTPMARARQVKRAMVARFGRSLEVEGHTFAAFPEAGALAEASPSAIAEVVRHPQKATAIYTVARAFAEMPEDGLRTLPYDEADTWLRALPMIGDFSSNFILFRGLGRLERFASQSEHLVSAIRRVYHAPELSDREALALGERYGEWKGYWALYLRASA
ncbi:DNA-3-methyladenine glycosylase family protein [Pendulispora albinea]|uniref:DNA-3-methyladenine glycosylase II n=1 Tax=Pendulispora albinea TaxID=2741071 RepID=A0ABZ2M161_9BACT